MERTAKSVPLESRLLIVLGLGLWLACGLASVWEVLALQAPDSPFHLGILAGPIAQLRSFSFGLGTILMASGWLWPLLYEPGRGRLPLGALALGSVLQTAVLTAAAAQGVLAIQVFDPRPDIRTLLYARATGHALCLLGGSAVLVRALQRFKPHRA